jgi:hypothetical protein
MSVLIKSSMLLLPASALGVYLYVSPGAEGLDPVRSQPHDEICTRDGNRLAQLQAKPSLDQVVRFGGELKCLKLWPQLQALLDSLTNTVGSAAAPILNGANPRPTSAEDVAPAPPSSPAIQATSTTSDDVCKSDEERLAELQAKPSISGAIRFGGELRCSRLRPQLLAVLDSLGYGGKPAGVSTDAAPDASPDEPAPSTSSSLAVQPSSTTSDDACKRDEDRLAELQAKPSIDGAIRFDSELRCPRLQPQLPAVLKMMSGSGRSSGPTPSGSQGASKDIGAGTSAPNEAPPPSEAAAAADGRVAALESEKEALAAKVSHLEREREAPSAEQAVPPSSPQPAIPAERSETQPASQADVDAERRIAQLESEREALAAKVSQLEREAPSAGQARSTPSPPPATPAERPETQPASQADVDAERRIAQLKSEKGELAAEVRRLQHDRDSPTAVQTASSSPPPPTAPAERSDSELVAARATLPEGMPARVVIRYLTNNADARARAQNLASALAKQGVEVADLRESAAAVRTDLSFSYKPDEAIAQQVGRLAGIAPLRRVQPKDGLMARPGTIELSLSGDNRLAATLASKRESNHE